MINYNKCIQIKCLCNLLGKSGGYYPNIRSYIEIQYTKLNTNSKPLKKNNTAEILRIIFFSSASFALAEWPPFLQNDQDPKVRH